MTALQKQQAENQMVTPASRHALNPFQEMERMFESFSNRNWLRPFHRESPLITEMDMPFGGKMPSVDVLERDDEILVTAELPGVDKKDLEISLTDSSVTIKGSSSHEEKSEDGSYYRCEISKGSYLRTVGLPAEIDEDKAKADFKDGMLKLTLPKVQKAHRRVIKVD